jgi:hypothetical protein
MTTETHPFLNVYDNMTSMSSCDQVRLASLLGRLPERGTCDYLYGIFICCVHPITPYFHLPTFDRRYHRFWDWLSHWDRISVPQGILAEAPSFLALLLAVLYYGSIIEPLVTNNEWICTTGIEPTLFLQLGTTALGMVDFPNKTTVYSLVAFMLLQMDQLRCQHTSACSFVAVAVRIAQSMGLHREESNLGLQPIDAEERRRIWCLLMHIDMVTARRAGLAPLLTHPPPGSLPLLTETRDEYIGIKITGDTRQINPAYVLAKGRYKASLCIKPILARQIDQNAVALADVRRLGQSVGQLALDLEERIARIREMGIKNTLALEHVSIPQFTLNQLRPDPEAYVRWAEVTLRYTGEQAYCELYNLTLKDVEIWHILRDECVSNRPNSRSAPGIEMLTRLIGPFLIIKPWCNTLSPSVQVMATDHINGYILDTTNLYKLSRSCWSISTGNLSLSNLLSHVLLSRNYSASTSPTTIHMHKLQGIRSVITQHRDHLKPHGRI